MNVTHDERRTHIRHLPEAGASWMPDCWSPPRPPGGRQRPDYRTCDTFPCCCVYVALKTHKQRISALIYSNSTVYSNEFKNDANHKRVYLITHLSGDFKPNVFDFVIFYYEEHVKAALVVTSRMGRVVMAVRCKTFQYSKHLFVLKEAMSALVVVSDMEIDLTTKWTYLTQSRWVATAWKHFIFFKYTNKRWPNMS